MPEYDEQVQANAQGDASSPETTQDTSQGGGPWMKELEARFSDPAQRTEFDGFLREHVQPYVTRLEQSQNPDASQLYEDLTSNPGATYLELTEELFGEDAAQAVIDALQGDGQIEESDDDYEESDEFSEAPQDPRVEAMLNDWESTRLSDAYDSEMERITSANPDVEPDLFHPFVAGADGDFDVALEGYNVWSTQFAERFGRLPSESDIPDAPQVMGEEGSVSTPPVQKDYKSIDDAIEDFMAEKRTAPNTVGSV